jgi:hypothetical protein
MRAAHSSTLVTELLLTPTYHGWTSLITFHPELAIRALFELCAPCKIDKRLILRIQALISPILLAAHILVILAPALQAIILTTAFAVELRDIGIVLEDQLAIRCRAPARISSVSLNISIHLIAMVFFLQFRCKIIE